MDRIINYHNKQLNKENFSIKKFIEIIPKDFEFIHTEIDNLLNSLKISDPEFYNFHFHG